MLRHCLLTLLVVALTACAAVPMPTLTTTATLVAQSAATSTPTETATLVPTATPVPTQVPAETPAPTKTATAEPATAMPDGSVDEGPTSLGYQELLNVPEAPPFYLLLGGRACANPPNPNIQWQANKVEFNPDYTNAQTGKGAQETFAHILITIYDKLDATHPNHTVLSPWPDETGFVEARSENAAKQLTYDRKQGIVFNIMIGTNTEFQSPSCMVGTLDAAGVFGIVPDGPHKGQVWINGYISEAEWKSLLKSAVQNNLDSESYALSVILRIFSNDLIRAEGNKFFHNHEPYPPEIIKLVSILQYLRQR